MILATKNVKNIFLVQKAHLRRISGRDYRMDVAVRRKYPTEPMYKYHVFPTPPPVIFG
jgi:hypothetical protein